MSLSLALAMLAQGASTLPWIPPLRSRSLVEVPISASASTAALENLARDCAARKMALVSRTDMQLVCSSEPDSAAQLAYMTARPRPDGKLQGYVRFSVQKSGESMRIQGVRYATYQAIGEQHQLLSEDTALLREMLDRAQIQR